MDTRDNDVRGSSEPLMRPLEELEQEAYPGRGEGEPGPREEDHDALMPTTILPLAGSHHIAAPVVEFEDDNESSAQEDRKEPWRFDE